MENSLQPGNQILKIDSVDLNKLKEYFQLKGGRTKYSELFNTFRDFIASDSNADDQFHETLNVIANKKIDHETNEEWWVLKKKYFDTSVYPSSGSNIATTFFVNTFQKTKQNLSKFESRLTNAFSKENYLNSSKTTKQFQNQHNDEQVSTIIQNSSSQLEEINANANEEQQQVDNNNVKSVKEQAKKLNRLNTTSELNNYKRNVSSSYLLKDQNKVQMSKSIDIETLDLSSTNTKPHEKEWIVVCSKPDSYMDIARLLSKHSYLAQKKDPFNGYTCLHLAYIYGNSSNTTQLIQTLVQYGAQSIPDFNGKLGMEYAVGSNEFISIDVNDRKPSLLDFTSGADSTSKQLKGQFRKRNKAK